MAYQPISDYHVLIDGDSCQCGPYPSARVFPEPPTCPRAFPGSILWRGSLSLYSTFLPGERGQLKTTFPAPCRDESSGCEVATILSVHACEFWKPERRRSILLPPTCCSLLASKLETHCLPAVMFPVCSPVWFLEPL